MDERRRGSRRWVAPVLGAAGVVVGGIAIVRALGDDGDAETAASAAIYVLLILVLAGLLMVEQRRLASTASRVNALEDRLTQQEQALSEAGERDSLTGLPNRLAFYDMLEQDLATALEERRSLSCILIDLDNLRRLNDRYGHHFGDRVLQRFSRLLVRVLRGEDSVCRYGGDEFMVILHQTSPAQALSAAERIRVQLKREVFSDGRSAAAVTASFGIAAAPIPGVAHAGDLIERLEAAVLEAKRGGKDRIAADPAVLSTTVEAEAEAEPGAMDRRPARRRSDESEPLGE